MKKRDLNIKITLPTKKDPLTVRSVKTLELKKKNSLTKIDRLLPKRKLTQISEKPLQEKSSIRHSSSSSNSDNLNDIVVEDLTEVESLQTSEDSVSIKNSKKSVALRSKETTSQLSNENLVNYP